MKKMIALMLLVATTALAQEAGTKYDQLNDLFYGENTFVPALETLEVLEMKVVCYKASTPDTPNKYDFKISESFIDHGPMFPKERVFWIHFGGEGQRLRYEDETLFATYYSENISKWIKWIVAKVDETLLIKETRDGEDYDYCYSFKE
jgi:hypothetical protein